MHVCGPDERIKFGDYSPHNMRMLQIEADTNFECLSSQLTMDDGNGVSEEVIPNTALSCTQ